MRYTTTMFGDDDAQASDDGLQISARLVAFVVGAVLLVAFTVQNTDEVRVELLFWDFTAAKWLLVLASAIAGALVWNGVGIVRRRRR